MTAEPRGPVVELEIRLDAPPEDVFPYLVDPERYVQWQGVRADLDPRPGGAFRVWMDALTVASGEYFAFEAPVRVVFTWGWEGSDEIPPRLDHGRAQAASRGGRHRLDAPSHGIAGRTFRDHAP
jgi:uncharacterized protein YndB with AHSA1/START domain